MDMQVGQGPYPGTAVLLRPRRPRGAGFESGPTQILRMDDAMQDICPKDMGEHDWQPHVRADGKDVYHCPKCGWTTSADPSEDDDE
jgi:predicted RNA-binding Zn-ribbon protein involved in translation (DUF1610 family)